MARASTITLVSSMLVGLLIIILFHIIVPITATRLLNENNNNNNNKVEVPSFGVNLAASALPKGKGKGTTPNSAPASSAKSHKAVDLVDGKQLFMSDRFLRSVPSPGVGHPVERELLNEKNTVVRSPSFGYSFVAASALNSEGTATTPNPNPAPSTAKGHKAVDLVDGKVFSTTVDASDGGHRFLSSVPSPGVGHNPVIKRVLVSNEYKHSPSFRAALPKGTSPPSSPSEKGHASGGDHRFLQSVPSPGVGH